LLLPETCADSMQSPSDLLQAFIRPTSPDNGQKYRTEIAPVQDMRELFSGNPFTLSKPTSNHAGVEDDELFETNWFATLMVKETCRLQGLGWQSMEDTRISLIATIARWDFPFKPTPGESLCCQRRMGKRWRNS